MTHQILETGPGPLALAFFGFGSGLGLYFTRDLGLGLRLLNNMGALDQKIEIEMKGQLSSVKVL